MGRVIGAVLGITLLLLPAVASAKFRSTVEYMKPGVYELDIAAAAATKPGAYNGGFGFDAGVGYALTVVDASLQARFDVALYQFERTFSWGDGAYLRVPLTFGARCYLPVIEGIRAFAQAGLEASFDSYDYAVRGVKTTRNDVNLGFSPGGGIEFFVNPTTTIFALGRLHVIFDSYATLQFGMAFHY